MREGWVGDDYLILFSDSEIDEASARYAISDFLPGFAVLGLRGWDDLIVTDSAGRTFSVPAVPISSRHVSAFPIPALSTIRDDERFTGKIKWYVTPLVFGGDPNSEGNVTWVVDHEAHGQLVRWWNGRYREMKKDG